MTILKFLVLVSITGLAAGCSPQRMAAPVDLEPHSDSLEVVNRSSFSGGLVDESFDVGEYQVTDVDRNWDVTSSFGVPGYSEGHTTGGYSYSLRASGGDWSADCAMDSDYADAELREGVTLSYRFSQFACSCNWGKNQATLLIDNSGSASVAHLNTDSARYELTPLYDLEGGGTTSDPAGFRADNASSSLGAVDVLKPGHMWLDTGLSETERAETACLFAGLMLYQAPSK